MILYPVIISCTDVCLTCRSKCNANCCTTCIILSLHILPVQHIPIHHIVLCCNMLPVSEITHTHSISKQHLSTLFLTSCNNKILLIMVFPPPSIIMKFIVWIINDIHMEFNDIHWEGCLHIRRHDSQRLKIVT